MTPAPAPCPAIRPTTPGLQVDDHMTVDVAMSVLVSARVPYLVLQDADGRCSGRVTRAQLAAHRGGPWYSDRTRLRDLPAAQPPPGASPQDDTHDGGPAVPAPTA
ncbi:hypothetical protein ACL02R_25640 [Streptomyces sp. MS19]|uniref:hypothetical protein n=1 Tax=Streptomyces sp. MS19 TaxID=3385972 RepID=UPI0039A1A37C